MAGHDRASPRRNPRGGRESEGGVKPSPAARMFLLTVCPLSFKDQAQGSSPTGALQMFTSLFFLSLLLNFIGVWLLYNVVLYQPFLFLKIYLFIYLFLAALGLRCCAWAFSSCGERGLLFVVVRGLLIAMASLVAEHGL